MRACVEAARAGARCGRRCGPARRAADRRACRAGSRRRPGRSDSRRRAAAPGRARRCGAPRGSRAARRRSAASARGRETRSTTWSSPRISIALIAGSPRRAGGARSTVDDPVRPSDADRDERGVALRDRRGGGSRPGSERHSAHRLEEAPARSGRPRSPGPRAGSGMRPSPSKLQGPACGLAARDLPDRLAQLESAVEEAELGAEAPVEADGDRARLRGELAARAAPSRPTSVPFRGYAGWCRRCAQLAQALPPSASAATPAAASARGRAAAREPATPRIASATTSCGKRIGAEHVVDAHRARDGAGSRASESTAAASTKAAARLPDPRRARSASRPREEGDRERVEHEEGARGGSLDVDHAFEAAARAHQAVEVGAVEHPAQRAELLAPQIGVGRRRGRAARHQQRRAELAQQRRGAEQQAPPRRAAAAAAARAAPARRRAAPPAASASAAAASGTAKSILL